jgi:hypothetical protein
MKTKFLPTLIAVGLLSFPVSIFAQAPNLGTAANFVLFTITGAVGNTGISQITGNVGTNAGAISSFGNVDGGMHIADVVTLQCATDLLIADAQLSTAIPTSSLLPVLGNGQTLTPGVYFEAAATSINLTLILDGQGDPNALFVFQVVGALTSSAGAQVVLINGAMACNVFWRTGGAASFAAGTSMKGTIIADNAAVSFGAGCTLEGRALSTTGAVNVYGDLAYTPVGCGSPLLTGPAAPLLVSAGCFALFSANGAVTNSGLTNVTGDIGTNTGAPVGYIPANVIGTIHTGPDASTVACVVNLTSIYTALNTLPADIQLLYPAQFGNGLVLTPHTYLLNAATALTDTLFLNAEGDANAVFVFQVNGALTTSANAIVSLINGAQASNVYWKVEGAATIGNGADFKGLLVCNNGAIVLNTGSSLEGRAFATNGNINTFAATATDPPSSCTVLPATWLYFRGQPVLNKVLLQWGTTNVMDNGFFTLERSSDDLQFESLTNVNVLETNGKPSYDYSFTDQQPFANGYYRISQTNDNGQKNYFVTIEVSIGQLFKVVQYVRGDYIYLQTSGAIAGNGSIELYSMAGERIVSQAILLNNGAGTYKIEKPLQKGIYLLFMEGNGERLYDGKVLVI